MKNLLAKQNKLGRKPRFKFNRKIKLFLVLFVLLWIVVGINELWKGVDAFYNDYYFQRNRVITITLRKPIEIKKREPKVVENMKLIEIIETIPNPEDLKTEPEKLIYKYFGIEHYRMAIAVSKCEGLNHPADGFNVNNNGSIDVGYMRINSINFKLEGCSLLEVATPEGNIACGYKIWDRGDGIEGNGEGNFNAWVGFTNGCALTKYE